MSPKEKAKELFDKYQIAGSQWYVDTTKRYCLITVDEILQVLSTLDNKMNLGLNETPNYWLEVKTEIEKL
jgi:hypothetical protein